MSRTRCSIKSKWITPWSMPRAANQVKWKAKLSKSWNSHQIATIADVWSQLCNAELYILGIRKKKREVKNKKSRQVLVIVKLVVSEKFQFQFQLETKNFKKWRMKIVQCRTWKIKKEERRRIQTWVGRYFLKLFQKSFNPSAA